MAVAASRMTGWIKRGVQVTRAPFFTASIVPVLLGAAVAWAEGPLDVRHLALTLLGAVAINAGLDMSNDYFDHLSGNDTVPHDLTPFSGGSRSIQSGLLSPGQALAWSLAFYGLGIAIGVYLAVARGWGVALVGGIGVFLAFFHNAPPIKLYHLAPGLGELAVGIGCGPVIVLGAYYVQAGQFSLPALLASLPVGLLIAAVLCANEFPDREADAHVGRKTLPVVLGRERAVLAYAAMVVGVYVAIVVPVAIGLAPPWALLGLATFPLAISAIERMRRFHSDTQRLVPVLATTIQLHLLTGVLLVVGHVLAHLV